MKSEARRGWAGVWLSPVGFACTGFLTIAALPLFASSVVESGDSFSTNAVTSSTSSNTVSLTRKTGEGDNRLTFVGVSCNSNTTRRNIFGATFTLDDR